MRVKDVQPKEVLQKTLKRIDRRGYKAYKDIEGVYSFDRFILYIDHVQGDPFASPSRLRVRLLQADAELPEWSFSNSYRKLAAKDFLIRQFHRSILRFSKRNRGSGKSGLFAVDCPGQEVIERTACVLNKEFVEMRFVCGLPASGRTILADEAIKMLFVELPKIVENSLFYKNIDTFSFKRHIYTVEDNCVLRESLKDKGLVSFIANGSILPRESGVSQRPMSQEEAVPFKSPPSLEIAFELPNKGIVYGMEIKEGVTLIVGGGYHGKTTLLGAIERAVYPHIPGDGREYVATIDAAVKIRAEDGRYIEGVNISAFINNLPRGKDTTFFSTLNASGSTSQAANIVEALEAGAKLLLIDEDTSATNFMIRDARMQALVKKEKEPITPFIDLVRPMYKRLGVSTVVVIGGSGDYLDVADSVIMMDEYLPRDVTCDAKQIAKLFPTGRRQETVADIDYPKKRVPLSGSISPYKRSKKAVVKTKGKDVLIFGEETVNLSYLSQLVEESQTRGIGEFWYYAFRKGYIDGNTSLIDIIYKIMGDIKRQGLDVISHIRGGHPGDYALPRVFEIIGAANRLRSLKIKKG